MPTGPYNTEFQEAKARLGSVTDELKSTQTEYDARMKELDGRETELERKKAELLRRQTEVEQYIKRSLEEEQQLNTEKDQQAEEIAQSINEISRLTDNIAGATALLQVLQDRNQQYQKYSDFIEDVYNLLNPQKDEQENQQTSANAQKFDKIYKQQLQQEYIRNVFSKLQNEEQQSLAAEQDLQKKYAQIQLEQKQKELDNAQEITTLEQEIGQLSQELDHLSMQKDIAMQDSEQLNIKQDSKTRELSQVCSSIQNLVKRIDNVKEERHDYLTAKATISDLLGGDNPKLEAQVKQYYENSKGLIPKDQCYEKVLGETLIDRLRDIYKLSLFLQDIQELVEICETKAVK